ncbi:MAG: Rieske 2Fe-2S domain-containing protein, partial [Proteobacteria bacterium]|nr:Rieske 2Fe-2S domain-containing protein [Pseudomonadota bacterium]
MDASSDQQTEIVRDVPFGLEKGLPNYWYPVLQSEELNSGKSLAFKVMGKELVAWRNSEGHPRVVVDRCPHRSAKLSLGHVLNGGLQCPLHGIRFDGDGNCVRIPWEADDSAVLDTVTVTSYPARELGGYIWAFL